MFRADGNEVGEPALSAYKLRGVEVVDFDAILVGKSKVFPVR